MKKLTKFVAFLLCIALFCPLAATAETIKDILPVTPQWGLSRTRFREANSQRYTDIELEGYKSLMRSGLDISGFTMDAYYQFGTDKGSYYGLSKVVYLVDVTKKMSNKNLEACYTALVNELSSQTKPHESAETKSVWNYETCTVEIATGIFTGFNGSKNKTVAIIITEPSASALANAPVQMRVNISASCSNYNHVGYSWSQDYFINGNSVSNWSTISLTAGYTITVGATIVENDTWKS